MTGADLARDKREGRQDESETSADERCPVSKLLLEKSHKPYPKLDSQGGCFVPLGDPEGTIAHVSLPLSPAVNSIQCGSLSSVCPVGTENPSPPETEKTKKQKTR